LGTAEPSYPVSLSPSREATALVTAPAEGWAAGPPGLVAAIASQTAQPQEIAELRERFVTWPRS